VNQISSKSQRCVLNLKRDALQNIRSMSALSSLLGCSPLGVEDPKPRNHARGSRNHAERRMNGSLWLIIYVYAGARIRPMVSRW
jgi:hypothetical protein